jgi:hypothetical protein
MTIPRRDLLTGTALVLLGSASGCGKTPAPVTAPTPPLESASSAKLLRTQFMKDFTTMFIGDPTTMKTPGDPDTWPDPSRKWPDPNTKLGRDVVASQYAMFVNLLMTFGYIGPPPAKPSDPLGGSIWQFLTDQKWPIGMPPTPGYNQGTVTKVEMGVILDRLLQAMNSYNAADGSGGPPGVWPPH